MIDPKQVIVVNASLKLPKGKLAAQVAHAAVSAFLDAGQSAREAWLGEGMPKVVVAAPDEDELLRCFERAQFARIPSHLIRDAGRTVVAAGTITCAGIGPAPSSAIDAITGHLKLL